MTVYIEYVIIDNFAFTYLIAVLSYVAMRRKVLNLRCLIVATIGTVGAIVYPLVHLPSIVLVALKLSLGAVLSLILFFKKKWLLGAMVFVGITFLMGGALFGIGYLVYNDVYKALTLPIADFPFGIVVGLGLVVYFIARRIILKCKKNRDRADYMYDYQFGYRGTTFKGKAFLDSGNRLYHNNLPVVMVSFKKVMSVFSDSEIAQILNGKASKVKGVNYLECNSLGGSSKILIVQPEEFRLYFDNNANTIVDVAVGLAFVKLIDTTEYDMILNPGIM